ncbi:MAG: TerB family tellurite resistance protein [Deltaproteobacteria bacterium]|nr:TerB family tellurite resistance protein [Deltaproteobacteria bacterium]
MAIQILNHLLAKIQSVFADKPADDAQNSLESLKTISKCLSDMSADQASLFAAFAFILHRVAYADNCVTPDESIKIKTILMRWGAMTEAQAKLVSQIAAVQNQLKGGTDNYLVSREFKETATGEQKSNLLRCLFAVAASDDLISALESDTVRMISKELGFSHREFIEIRRDFVDKLAALK